MVMVVRVVAVLTMFVPMVMAAIFTMLMVVMVVMLALAMVVVAMAVVVIVLLEEIWIDVQFRVQVKAKQIKHILEGHIAKVHRTNGCARVHVLQAMDERVFLGFRYQVRLGQEDLIGKAHLAARFLARVQLLVRVLGIHQRDDGINQACLGNLFVHEEGLRHRARVCKACGFDHDAVKIQQAFAALGSQQLQGFAQVFTDGAADAAIAHLQNLLFRLRLEDVGVDVFFAELVLDHGNLHAVRFMQHTLEQRGFARA